MYLLDFISREMLGEKRDLALKLLRDPLRCAPAEMQQWVDGRLCDLFSLAQSQCARDLRSRTPNLFGVKMGGMRIAVTGTLPDGTEFPSDELSGHVASQLWGLIREDFWHRGEHFDGFPVETKMSLTLLYAMAELVFWLLFGVLQEVDGRFSLTDDHEILEGCRLYFLGHQLARESLISDALDQAYLLEEAKRKSGSIENLLRNDALALECLVDRTLDKCFGCHPQYIDLMQEENKKQFDIFRRRSRLICYLFLHSQEELAHMIERSGRDFLATAFATSVTIEKLTSLGFVKEDIEFLLHCSDNAAPGENLFQQREDNYLAVGNLNLKYALVAYSKDFFDSNAMYGDWFDKAYIASYLKARVESSRYAVLEELTPSDGYDVDAMIFDREFGRLYFFQVKHRDKTTLPYLRDELGEFSMNKAMNKAVTQLKRLKENFGSKKLVDKIKNSFQKAGLSSRLIDSEYLRSHSGVIILHSIENFDFGVKDGVAMYEWNTFRTLLKQEMICQIGGVSCPVRMDLGGPPLDDPAKVAEALIGWLDSQPRSSSQPSFAEKLRMKEGFYYDIVSTRVLEILGRWKFPRPFLHLRFPLV
jgi:hypothetical protein